FGHRLCAVLSEGLFLVNWVFWVGPGANPLPMMPPAVSGACGNTLETLAAAWLARTFARGRDAFRQPQTVLLFIAFAAVASTAIGAGIGARAEVWAGLTEWGGGGGGGGLCGGGGGCGGGFFLFLLFFWWWSVQPSVFCMW